MLDYADFASELHVLILFCRQNRSPKDMERLNSLLDGGIDLSRVAQLARIHRVTPPVYRNALTVDHPALPDFIAGLRAEVQANDRRVMRNSTALIQALKSLHASSVDVVLLKGLGVSWRYYGTYGARHCGDIDLLVHPDQLKRASGALTSAGFEHLSADDMKEPKSPIPGAALFNHHLNFSWLGVPLVELHARLHPNPALAPLRFDTIMHDGIPIHIAGVACHIMSDKDQAIYLAVHGARHTWRRLQWLCDFQALVSRCGQEELGGVIEIAERQGIAPTLLQSLLLLHLLFDTALPQDIIDRAWASRRVCYLVQRALESIAAQQRFDERPAKALSTNATVYLFSMAASARYYLYESLFRAIEFTRKRRSSSIAAETDDMRADLPTEPKGTAH